MKNKDKVKFIMRFIKDYDLMHKCDVNYDTIKYAIKLFKHEKSNYKDFFSDLGLSIYFDEVVCAYETYAVLNNVNKNQCQLEKNDIVGIKLQIALDTIKEILPNKLIINNDDALKILFEINEVKSGHINILNECIEKYPLCDLLITLYLDYNIHHKLFNVATYQKLIFNKLCGR